MRRQKIHADIKIRPPILGNPCLIDHDNEDRILLVRLLYLCGIHLDLLVRSIRNESSKIFFDLWVIHRGFRCGHFACGRGDLEGSSWVSCLKRWPGVLALGSSCLLKKFVGGGWVTS